MLRSSRPELAVEKSGLPKSNVSIKEFGVDDEGKGLFDKTGLFCMVSLCRFVVGGDGKYGVYVKESNALR